MTAMAETVESPWMTQTEAASYLRLSTRQIRRLVRQEAITRYGGQGKAARYRKGNLDRYLETHPIELRP